MNTEALRLSLKKMVLAECNVQNVLAENLADDMPIIGGGQLNLDSLDAVEIVAALERSFAIRLENAGDAREVFKSFRVMEDYVIRHATFESVERFVAKA